MLSRITLTALAVSLCTGAFLGGCAPVIYKKDLVNVVEVNYEAVDRMLASAREKPSADSKIIAATFVDVDDMTNASTLGRLMGEVCSARLTQKGYTAVNMKMRANSVVIKPGSGEFVLSRDAKLLAKDYGAETVLVGTYTRTNVGPRVRSVSQELEEIDPALESPRRRTFVVVDDWVYVSLRLVKAEDNSVIAAYDYRMPCDEGVASLLAGEAGGYPE